MTCKGHLSIKISKKMFSPFRDDSLTQTHSEKASNKTLGHKLKTKSFKLWFLSVAVFPLKKVPYEVRNVLPKVHRMKEFRK